jgi:hypothetical protein
LDYGKKKSRYGGGSFPERRVYLEREEKNGTLTD